MKYYEPKSGEWVQPRRKGYKLACCDCALCHRMDFRIYKGKIQFRVFRNNRSTAAMRRHLETNYFPFRPTKGKAK